MEKIDQRFGKISQTDLSKRKLDVPCTQSEASGKDYVLRAQ